MSHFSDPLTVISFALIASFAVGLLFTSGRRRAGVVRVRARSQRRRSS